MPPPTPDARRQLCVCVWGKKKKEHMQTNICVLCLISWFVARRVHKHTHDCIVTWLPGPAHTNSFYSHSSSSLSSWSNTILEKAFYLIWSRTETYSPSFASLPHRLLFRFASFRREKLLAISAVLSKRLQKMPVRLLYSVLPISIIHYTYTHILPLRQLACLCIPTNVCRARNTIYAYAYFSIRTRDIRIGVD